MMNEIIEKCLRLSIDDVEKNLARLGRLKKIYDIDYEELRRNVCLLAQAGMIACDYRPVDRAFVECMRVVLKENVIKAYHRDVIVDAATIAYLRQELKEECEKKNVPVRELEFWYAMGKCGTHLTTSILDRDCVEHTMRPDALYHYSDSTGMVKMRARKKILRLSYGQESSILEFVELS